MYPWKLKSDARPPLPLHPPTPNKKKKRRNKKGGGGGMRGGGGFFCIEIVFPPPYMPADLITPSWHTDSTAACARGEDSMYNVVFTSCLHSVWFVEAWRVMYDLVDRQRRLSGHRVKVTVMDGQSNHTTR